MTSMLRELEFRTFVNKLFVKRRDGLEGYLHATVGLAGEGGEVLDLVKKSWAYGKPLDNAKMLEEMGDVLHYFTMLCIKMGVTWDDVIESNMAKLKKRYPDGYSDRAAIQRADVMDGKLVQSQP